MMINFIDQYDWNWSFLSINDFIMSPDELLTRIQKEDHEKIDSRGAARPPLRLKCNHIHL